MRNLKSLLTVLSIAAGLVVCAPGARADMAAAKTNFDTFCAKCHGAQGKGDGSGAATLATKPRDFADCARMAKESDDMLFKVIKEGGKANGFSGDMAAWNAAFEDSEIKDLVAYIHTFCKE
jgi:high-affinity iron transporter